MILAIGDSFTYGAELANPGNDAWPTVLGRLLNQDVVNQGLTGSSNDRILRLAATNVVKYDLVICAWSGIDRSEVHSRKGLVQLNFNVRTEIITYPWLKQYLTDHYNYDHATQCWIIDVIMLQAYFQQIQQPFLFVNAIYKKIPSSLRYLWDKVGDKTFIDKNNSMQEWCANYPRGNDCHFLEQGHDFVAKKLAQYITDNSLMFSQQQIKPC